MEPTFEKVLEVKNLVTEFRTDRGLVRAVDNVSFDVFKGRTIGIVGESGSGKSVTALSIMRLIGGNIASGEVLYRGKDLTKVPMGEMQSIRGAKISMIFQEPMTSLNPVYTIGDQIEEVIALHQPLNKKDRKNRAVEMLQLVGIPAPEKRAKEYPHQLSGGMRQRVMIAMALACRPEILIADEPTTALDVTIQAQILELIVKLQEELGMGVIMITHDLGVVAETCHDVAVMYCGKIVEKGTVQKIFGNPAHPYTRGLLDSIPRFDSTIIHSSGKGKLKTIEGMVPSLLDLPVGCSFQDRCSNVQDQCRVKYPTLESVTLGHSLSCHNPHMIKEVNV